MKIYKTNNYGVRLVRDKTTVIVKKIKVSSSDDTERYLRGIWTDIDIYESFYIIALNNANNTLDYMCISKGGICGTIADLRMIAKFALDKLATAVIIAHNHPSGTLKPSMSDLRLTDNIKKGLKTLDILLLDHLILTENEHYSFANNGKL